MGDLTEGVNSYFYLSALTILVGGAGLLIRFAYKSKCKEVSCCCIKVVRDVDIEEHEDLEELKRRTISSSYENGSPVMELSKFKVEKGKGLK